MFRMLAKNPCVDDVPPGSAGGTVPEDQELSGGGALPADADDGGGCGEAGGGWVSVMYPSLTQAAPAAMRVGPETSLRGPLIRGAKRRR